MEEPHIQNVYFFIGAALVCSVVSDGDQGSKSELNISDLLVFCGVPITRACVKRVKEVILA